MNECYGYYKEVKYFYTNAIVGSMMKDVAQLIHIQLFVPLCQACVKLNITYC